MGIKVTVVVPIKNGSVYLERCARFLREQSFSDFETIFVIDSESIDGTLEMVPMLETWLPGSRVIMQNDNLMLGGNRNLGLSEAKGDMICFVDVDDAPAPDYLADMYRLIEETGADFVCCNFVNTGPLGIVNENDREEYHHKVLNRQEALISRNDEEFPVSTWSKMFRRSFLIDNELTFAESYAEDIIHTYKCISKCTRICIYDRPLYAYCQTAGSVCRSKSNIDNRGRAEISAYDYVDGLFPDNLLVLKKNALMKIRSSGHMSYNSFKQFTRSDKNRCSYETYLMGTLEGWINYHLPTWYFAAIRTYVKLIYKRNGTRAMRKKFW